MKKYIITFIVGIAVGSGSYWTFRDGPLATKVRENQLVQKVGETLQDRAANRLKDEMEKQGKVVMSKPAGSTVPDLEDGRLSDLVKAKLAAEPMLVEAAIKQEVKNGEVALRGSASSYEQVARAMRLALDCDATKSVVSTIEVKAK